MTSLQMTLCQNVLSEMKLVDKLGRLKYITMSRKQSYVRHVHTLLDTLTQYTTGYTHNRVDCTPT